MRLKNKKTGEIVEYDIIEAGLKVNPVGGYIAADSLTEFCDEWEDVEEPKEYWYLDCYGMVLRAIYNGNEWDERRKLIGNYFETREEAEKAVEKLKAWKRLKDKGFRFSKDWVYRYDQPFVKDHTYLEFVAICEDGALFDDLDLLFCPEVKNERY